MISLGSEFNMKAQTEVAEEEKTLGPLKMVL